MTEKLDLSTILEKGDIVYCLLNNYGVVLSPSDEKLNSEEYPIVIQFLNELTGESYEKTYTLDGRYETSNENMCLFPTSDIRSWNNYKRIKTVSVQKELQIPDLLRKLEELSSDQDSEQKQNNQYYRKGLYEALKWASSEKDYDLPINLYR